MAVEFTGGLINYATPPPLTTPPITIACWFKSDSAALRQTLVSLSDNDLDYRTLELAGNVAGDPVRALSQQEALAAVYADTSSGYSTGVWQHAAAVWAASNDRRAYLSGGNKGTEATDRTIAAPLDLSIGTVLISGMSSNNLDGCLAEVGIWNVALTDAEIALLATGVRAFAVRPANLVGYYPLIKSVNPQPNRIEGQSIGFLMSSPTTAAHPRILSAAPPINLHPPLIETAPSIELTIKDIADMAQVALADPGESTWSQSTIEAWVLEAIRDYSNHFTRRQTYQVATLQDVHDYDLPPDLETITLVEYPLDEDPPVYLSRLTRRDPRFWSDDCYYDWDPQRMRGVPATIWISAAPEAGQTLRVEYTAPYYNYTQDPPDTTVYVPDHHLPILINYVVWKAAVERLYHEMGILSPTSLISELSDAATAARAVYDSSILKAKGTQADGQRTATWKMDTWDRIY